MQKIGIKVIIVIFLLLAGGHWLGSFVIIGLVFLAISTVYKNYSNPEKKTSLFPIIASILIYLIGHFIWSYIHTEIEQQKEIQKQEIDNNITQMEFNTTKED